jgi:hypothetical protein
MVSVCVSALLIQEIKRIIKESEIMKYVWAQTDASGGFADDM